jgi:hypothetical protein
MLYSRFKRQQKDISGNNDLSMNVSLNFSQKIKKVFFNCSKTFIAENPIPNWMRYLMYIIETLNLLKFGVEE